MLAPREQIIVAIFNALSAATGAKTVSRRLEHWNKVDVAAMPALYISEGDQGAKGALNTGLPYKWNWKLEIFVYTSVGEDQQATPATQLNEILDAIESVFSPVRSGEKVTFGGLVDDCRIAGAVKTDEGVLGSVAVAIVPIELSA